jgi:hypothetical protein
MTVLAYVMAGWLWGAMAFWGAVMLVAAVVGIAKTLKKEN